MSKVNESNHNKLENAYSYWEELYKYDPLKGAAYLVVKAMLRLYNAEADWEDEIAEDELAMFFSKNI